MIEIRMHDDKWRLTINETLQFNDLLDLEKELRIILALKDRHGRIK